MMDQGNSTGSRSAEKVTPASVSVATLDAACERIRDLEADMRRIRDLCKPGQRLGISDAIDIICDVYTFANEAIR